MSRAVGRVRLAYERRAAVGAEFRVPLGARPALFAYRGGSGPHHGERLLGVARLERLIIRVGDLAGFTVKLQLAERIDCKAWPRLRAALSTACRVSRCDRDVRAKEGVEHEAERRDRERSTDQKRR